jgi:hypothetical protein
MVRNIFTSVARPILAVATLAVVACTEPTTSPAPGGAPSLAEVKVWEGGSSVAWNKTARDLMAIRGTGAAPQARILAYLSVAQYNAIVTAEDTKDRGDHASAAGAATGASDAVLRAFFPNDAATLNTQLEDQRTASRWAGEKNKDFAAGEAIGRAIGAKVLAHAATDRLNAKAPPASPGGDSAWTGTNPLRGHYGARTFALTSDDQFRPAGPPGFKSLAFAAALKEVQDWSAENDPAKNALAATWAGQGAAYMNSVATDLLTKYKRSERESARILAVSNMAGFDVLAACFDAKFAFYLIRPSQIDATIRLPVGLPNHPSYPSGHSCVTAAYATVLGTTFPEETEFLQGLVTAAGLSRNYGGLHYRFDCEDGQELGRRVAEWVMSKGPTGHKAIPLVP